MRWPLPLSGWNKEVVLGLALLCVLAGCGGDGGDDDGWRATRIDANASVNGTLTGNDYKAPDGTPFDLYKVTLGQAGRLTVRLESTAFDAYLVAFEGAALSQKDLNLWDPYLLGEDDDSGGGFDAELSLNLAAGTYLIAASTADGTGDYTLRTAFSATQVPLAWLQYRVYEGGAGNRYQGWIQLSREGAPVEEGDIADVRVRDPLGTPLEPTFSGFSALEYYGLNCIDVDPCTEIGLFEDRGVWGVFPELSEGTYSFEVDLVDGSSVSGQIEYPGQLVLPIVSGTTMQAQWAGNDLTLSWGNPTSAPNWSEVDRYSLVLFDGTGKDVLYVRVPASASQITLPGETLNRAAALGNGTLAQWELQSRAYTGGNSNYARGYSPRAALPPIPRLGNVYLQYRAYPGDVGNRYQGYIPLTREGAPVEASGVTDVRMWGPLGTPVEATSSGFFAGEYLYLNCVADPCAESGPLVDRGVWAAFSSLSAGTYSLEVDTLDGPTLSGEIEYPGQLVLPSVSGTTMHAQWAGSDLTLSWENPTSSPNWSQVDRYNLALFDGAGKDVLYVRLPAATTQFTLAGDLLSRAAALGNGTLAQWELQARAYTASNMNYARGYSPRLPLP